MMELYIDKGLRIALKNAESGARLGGEGGDGLKEVVDGHLTVLLVNDSEKGKGNSYARLQDYVRVLLF